MHSYAMFYSKTAECEEISRVWALLACRQVVLYPPNRGLEHDFFGEIMPVFVMLMALEHDFRIISNAYHWLECSRRMRNSLDGLRKSCSPEIAWDWLQLQLQGCVYL